MTRAMLVRSLVWSVIIVAALFIPAGTLDWPGGWIFVGEFVVVSGVITAWLARHDPGLLKERMGGAYQKGQTFADKLFITAMIQVWFGWLILMALDAKRWHTSTMPNALVAFGAVLIPLGFYIVWLTFRENSFAAPVIKIQQERGQKVIDTGLYAAIRHPMYAGAILFMLGMPLLLGSWLGFAALPAIVMLLIVRIFIEENALREGLPGYDAYAARVRYRLVPYVW
jgi:protein-S-isoprenylcysteine O-methyltransferase Ste14